MLPSSGPVPKRKRTAAAGSGPNAHIIQLLQHQMTKLDPHRAEHIKAAIRKAILEIAEHPVRLNNGKEAQKVKGVGPYIANLIDDYLPAFPPDDPNRPAAPELQRKVTAAIASLGDMSFDEDDCDDGNAPYYAGHLQRPAPGSVVSPSQPRPKRPASDTVPDQMDALRQSLYDDPLQDTFAFVNGSPGGNAVGTPAKRRREASSSPRAGAAPRASQTLAPSQARMDAQMRAYGVEDDMVPQPADDLLAHVPGVVPMEISTIDDTAALRRIQDAKPYIPKYGSGNWAILITLLTCAGNGQSITENDLRNHAERISDHSMWPDRNNPNGFLYSAWSGIEKLIENLLVVRLTGPTRYLLTPQGRVLATALEAERNGGPTVAKKTASPPRGGGAAKSPPRHASPPRTPTTPVRIPLPVLDDEDDEEEEDNLITPPVVYQYPYELPPLPASPKRSPKRAVASPSSSPPRSAATAAAASATAIRRVNATSPSQASAVHHHNLNNHVDLTSSGPSMIRIPLPAEPSLIRAANNTIVSNASQPIEIFPNPPAIAMASSAPQSVASTQHRSRARPRMPIHLPQAPHFEPHVAAFQPTWRYNPLVPTTDEMRTMVSYSREEEIVALNPPKRTPVQIPPLVESMECVTLPAEASEESPLNIHLEAHTIKKIILYVDSREKRRREELENKDYFQVSLQAIHNDPADPVAIRTLPLTVGDFLWCGVTDTKKVVVLNSIVERKTIFDLASSVVDGRFDEQKWRLRHSGLANVYYLIEGTVDMDSIRYDIPPDKIQTAIAHVAFIEKMTLLRPRDQRDTVRYLHTITKSIIDEYWNKQVYITSDTAIVTAKVRHHGATNFEKFERTYLLNEQYLCWTLEQFSTYMQKTKVLSGSDLFGHQLMGLTGISPHKAGAIVAKWKTLHNLLYAYQTTYNRADRINLVADITIAGKKLGLSIGTLVHDTIMGEGW